VGGGKYVGGHEFAAWRAQSQSLAYIAGYGSVERTVTGGAQAERVRCGEATSDLFAMLGVKALLGRFFLREEERPNSPRVAVLTHGFWQRRFGGDPGVIHQSILLDNQAYTVVGVLPASFQFPEPSDLWAPLQLQPMPETVGGGIAINLFQALARLKPGVSRERAQAELNLLAGRLQMPMSPPPIAGDRLRGNRVELLGADESDAALLPSDAFEPPGGTGPRPDGAPSTMPFPAPGRPPDGLAARGPMDAAGDVLLPGSDPGVPSMAWLGGGRIVLVGLHEQLVSNVRISILVMMGAVVFVLLIACTNVASLLLTRAIARQRELAIRLALGSPRTRLIRQLLVESVVLAALGGTLGLCLAWWGVRLLSSMSLVSLPRIQTVAIDPTVLAFTLVSALGTGLLFGLVPALQASGFRVNDVLKQGGLAASETRGGHRLRGGLVVGETALALVLLVSAGLLLNSFFRLRSVDPGFRQDGLLTFQLQLPATKYVSTEQRAAFLRQLRQELEALPGVQGVALTDHLPLTSYVLMTSVSVVGQPREKFHNKPAASVAAVTPNYFGVLGIRVKEGRSLNEQDLQTGGIAVNERFAREYFPGESAVGKRLNNFAEHHGQRSELTIVGVVADARQDGLDSAATPEIYRLSLGQGPDFVSVAVQAAGDPLRLVPALRARVRQSDPDQAISDLMTMRERVEATLVSREAQLVLLGSLAALAMLLALVGLYGVVSYLVSQRTREIGIRLALGAQRREVLGLVIGQGMQWVLQGIALGLLGALALTRVLNHLLFEIHPRDPLTLVGVTLLLGAVAWFASWLAARRAAQVHPIVALRCE
jgi:ABC-type antimicrobial peptide transport system permease subunit